VDVADRDEGVVMVGLQVTTGATVVVLTADATTLQWELSSRSLAFSAVNLAVG